MQMSVKSQLIEALDYDEQQSSLRLYLTNGTLREFCDVPRSVVTGLVSAKSAGRYYIDNIRNRYPVPEQSLSASEPSDFHEQD